jgi:hypothetical protein
MPDPDASGVNSLRSWRHTPNPPPTKVQHPEAPTANEHLAETPTTCMDALHPAYDT